MNRFDVKGATDSPTRLVTHTYIQRQALKGGWVGKLLCFQETTAEGYQSIFVLHSFKSRKEVWSLWGVWQSEITRKRGQFNLHFWRTIWNYTGCNGLISTDMYIYWRVQIVFHCPTKLKMNRNNGTEIVGAHNTTTMIKQHQFAPGGCFIPKIQTKECSYLWGHWHHVLFQKIWGFKIMTQNT